MHNTSVLYCYWEIATEMCVCVRVCYITCDMDFQFVPSDPVCFDKLSRCD